MTRHRRDRQRKQPPPPPANPLARKDVAVALCFFLSGAVALTLEITWVRKASYVFGNTSFALSTVLAAFFAGLALGSYLIGRVTPRMTNPLKAYGLLELGIGAFAACSPVAFMLADRVYDIAYPRVFDSPSMLASIRFVLCFLVILPPTVLMGASLPLLCRHYVRSNARIAMTIGMLYGLNTIGAAFGAGLCGFIAIPTIGIHAAIAAAATVSAAVGLFALRLSRTVAPNLEPPPAKTNADPRPTAPGRTTLATVMHCLFFMVGFIALANEVLWTRFLSLMIYNTVHTYTFTLMIVLLGIAVGSASTGWLCDRTNNRPFLFGCVQVSASLIALFVVMLPATWWHESFDMTKTLSPLYVLAIVLFVPACLSGMSFPLAVRAIVSNPQLTGRTVGSMIAVNTLGGVLGALVGGFVLLPVQGLHSSLLVTTAVGVLVGVVAWFVLDKTSSLTRKGILTATAFALWLVIPRFTGTELPADFLARGGELVDFREGHVAHVAVIKRNDRLRLEMDRLWQGEDHRTHQVMAAHLPALLHPNPEDILAIGMGTGQTFSRFLMYDINHLHCVEIEPELIKVIRDHYTSDWLNDPRVRVIIEDGRNYVRHSDHTYDIISVAAGQTFRSGVASFYTTNFYRTAARRMNPDALICQFVPLPLFTMDELARVVRSFVDVFPNSTMWYKTAEVLLIGSKGDSPKLRRDRLDLLSSDRDLNRDLAFTYWGGPADWLNRPENLLGGFLLDGPGLTALAGDAAPYTDDRPVLEYTTARLSGRSAWNIDAVPNIRALLAPIDTACAFAPDDTLRAAAERARQSNLDNIMATRWINAAEQRAGNQTPERMIQLLERAVDANPRNFSAHTKLGDALRKVGQFDLAIAQFTDAIRIDAASAEAHHSLGLLLGDRRQQDAAIHEFKEALRLNPNYAQAHTNLASALLETGAVDDAIEHYNESLRLLPAAAETHANLGVALATKGLAEQACAEFRRALELQPDFTEVHLNLGRVLLGMSKFAEAAEHLRKAVGLGAGGTALENLADAYAKTGKADDARAAAGRALEWAVRRGDTAAASRLRDRIRRYERDPQFTIQSGGSAP